MNSLEALKEFLGWCSVINIGILLASTAMLGLMRGPISKIHTKMFGLSEVNLSSVYFQYLGYYKILILVLNLVPYIALVIMT